MENLSKPFIINNLINEWNVLKFSEDAWSNVFGEKKITFRCGSRGYSSTPQWERTCSKKEMSLSEFFSKSHKNESKDWLYFDYKNLEEVFPEDNEQIKGIDWSTAGFPEISKKKTTIWIGNEGAHTPCHMDTYGCNLIAQLYGRKLWLLMPPEEIQNLKPTRVPYEESSIYSSFNFYTPSNKILQIKTMYLVILEPGDMLYVPRHWWHFVENMDVAISVNSWIPLEEDDECRLEEVLVQRLIAALCQELTVAEAGQILNPNEDSIMYEEPKNEIFEAVIRKFQHRKLEKTVNAKPCISFKDNANILHLQPQSRKEVEEYIKAKRTKHKYSIDSDLKVDSTCMDRLATVKSLINAFCHPQVITIVKEKLVEETSI